MADPVDLLVIGGGAAGLAAAVAGEQRGLTCQVLEAQARLGGRVHTVETDTGPVDLGAQEINGDMTAVLDLAADAGRHLSPLPTGGAGLTVTGDAQRRRPAHERPDAWLALLTDGAPPAPGSSVADLLKAADLPQAEADLAQTVTAELFGQPAHRLDAEAVRRELATYESDRDPDEFQLRGGFGEVITALAGQLRRPPVMGTPVQTVRVVDDEVVVQTATAAWSARYVVITAPPPVARWIDYRLPAQQELSSLLAGFVAGDLIKYTAVYDRPFWRYDGLSGAATYTDPVGLVVADGSVDDGRAPRLTAFLGGPTARTWAGLPTEQRDQQLRHQLARAFGPAAAQPLAIHEAVWVDHPWSGGAYNSQVRAGAAADSADRLAAWGDRVVFAGAELAPRFRGFVEGAISSGRAAVARLG
ncbi:FAD-dependent oxidoreductase [Natronosporangium hydrolyticum]|uniref:FAD-dependent oxidoreductase n=1 Tax=Natronosporangium hydrolyticum TaxID=2811111 RepID=A0A895YD69_9ACTN|nr:NAD(P)/FAD-dependent oxidoreductase [Natronosporangium hydrolyticum]QSB14122.1 FAD-dependent oxidoreductase [Natronosporangium hydrolyticum]